MDEGNVPEKKFSTGVISATVWKNKHKSASGDVIEYRTVSLQRRYRDKSGEWKSSNSLRTNDLPKAILVLSKAYESLVLRDGESSDAIEEYEIEEID